MKGLNVSMNSRERVLTVFAHQLPDRVPCWCGASEEFWRKAKRYFGLDDESLRIKFHDDFRRVYPRYAGPQEPLCAGETCKTIFGVPRHGMGYGQPICHPLENASLKQIEEYRWPDPAWVDVSGIVEQAKPYRSQYAILGGDWSPFWHDAIDLLGMENLYIKMYTQPEIVDCLLSHIVDYYFQVNKRIFDAASQAIDIFFMGNDFGGQTGPLLSPEMFRRFIFPHLQRLADLGHQYQLKVQLHCCGGIYPLLPLLIEAGIDAVHAVQPSCVGMDLKKLKAEFGSKIVFNGAIDSHHVLIEGDVNFVRQKTREVLDIMMPGGGYIAGASHDTILEQTPVENVLAMFETVCEYGRY